MNKSKTIYSHFGANERAIVDKISINFIRQIVIQLIGFKLKLQWKGWLQYLIPVPLLMLLLLISFIFYLLIGKLSALIILGMAFLLLIKIMFDIITVKYKIRFPESRPKRNDDMNVFDLIQLRSSCRSFQTKKIQEKDFKELMESVERHLAESKFSNEKIRFEYISIPIRVWPVVNGTEFIVAIAPKAYNRLAIMDVGRTLQKIVIDATRMGLATCWIGPGADHKSITSQLGERFNPERDNIICVCAIGYKSKYIPLFINIFSRSMRQRLPIDSLFFDSHKMDTSININQEPYARFGRSYETCKWAPSSYNGQTTRGIIISEDNKVTRIDFMAVTSSRFYAAVASGIWCANWELSCNELIIDGRFSSLNNTEIDLTESQSNAGAPIYDISWVVN
jgi:hypothetical protein